MSNTKYYIDGWKVGENYFKSLGFTGLEWQKLLDGEVVVHGCNENECWIEVEED